MKLERLDIRRLPGIDDPFALTVGPAVNLVVGPNASGKSSLARAVRDLLWPARHDGGVRWLRARFRDGETELAVTCDGGAPVWTRGGQPVDPPRLPPPHLADCYRLTAPDLLGPDGDLDRGLAAAIRTEMTGGFDLDGLAATLPRPRRGATDLVNALNAAREDTARLTRAQDDLATRGAGLQELQERIAAAETAAARTAALAARRDLADARRTRDEATAALEVFPETMAAVRPEDPDTFVQLQQTLAARHRRVAELDAEIADLAGRLEGLTVPPGDAAGEAARIAALAVACRDAAHAAALAAERRTALADALAAAERAADTNDTPDDPLLRLQRTLDTMDAGLAAIAADADGAAGSAAVPGPGRAVALLVVAAVLVAGAALPLTAAPAVRLAAGAGALVLGALGVLDLVRTSRRRAVFAQRSHLAALATAAAARRDDLIARRDDLARAGASAAEARGRLDAALAAAATALVPWGLPAPSTAADAEAAAAALRDRLHRRGELADRRERARRDRDEADRDAAAAARLADDLRQRLGLPADLAEVGPVRDLADRLPAWSAARDARQAAEAACRGRQEDAARLAAAAQLPPEEDIPAGPALDAAIAAANEAAAAAPGLREDLGSLRQELKAAEAGHSLAVALAREQACREDLAAWRDRAREQLAEAALLDELRHSHDTLAAPPRLKEANRLLDEFTAGRHALALGTRDGAPVFTVADRRTDTHLDLAQLSDGTRAQVLLALRIAFVTGIEPGGRPPLFLDEALTTSDPTRLAAVAVSLGRLAATTGRQVFYLTSQPADVGAWRAALGKGGLPEPTILDLAMARGLGNAAGPDQLAPAPPPPVPAVDGRDAATYGALLQVPAFDPRQPWQAADTFHLAAPDLELVRRLRVAGVTAAGDWRPPAPAGGRRRGRRRRARTPGRRPGGPAGLRRRVGRRPAAAGGAGRHGRQRRRVRHLPAPGAGAAAGMRMECGTIPGSGRGRRPAALPDPQAGGPARASGRRRLPGRPPRPGHRPARHRSGAARRRRAYESAPVRGGRARSGAPAPAGDPARNRGRSV